MLLQSIVRRPRFLLAALLVACAPAIAWVAKPLVSQVADNVAGSVIARTAPPESEPLVAFSSPESQVNIAVEPPYSLSTYSTSSDSPVATTRVPMRPTAFGNTVAVLQSQQYAILLDDGLTPQQQAALAIITAAEDAEDGAPNPPTAVTATTSAATVTVTWSKDAAGVAPTSFNIERMTAPNGAWLPVASPLQQAGTNQSYVDTGLSAATYVYRVSACNILCSNPTLMTPASGITVTLPPKITFFPSGGAEGIASVTVYATNFVFNATPNQNTVKFGNNVPATVTSVAADGSSLQATVPIGATTGSVKVTAPKIVTSNNAFYVYPSPTQCQNMAPAVRPGSNPGTPGLWNNDKRYGTGWDFTFLPSSAQPKLHVAWYTYDSKGAPTWLSNRNDVTDMVTRYQVESLDGSSDPTKQISEYIVPLYLTTYPPGGQKSVVQVGQVAITFAPGSTTNATLNWQLNGAPFANLQNNPNECVHSFLGAAQRPGSGSVDSTTPIDESFTGYWAASSYGSTWGVYFDIGSGSSGTTEIDNVTIFDVSGNPVWLQGSDVNTKAASRTLNLGYAKSLYAGGVPTQDCNNASCSVDTAIDAPSPGYITRTFTDRANATVNDLKAVVTFADDATRNVNWPATSNFTVLPAYISKTTDQSIVTVDKTSCATSCSVVVSWTSANTSSYLYLYDINAGTLAATPVQDATAHTGTSSGTATIPLTNGYYQFELHLGSATGPATGASVFNSPEVIVGATSGLPGKPAFTAPNNPSGRQFTVSWSLNDSSVTSFHLQQATDSSGQSWSSDLQLTSPTAKSYSANVPSDGAYLYRVMACNDNGCGSWAVSSAYIVQTSTAPGFAADPGDDLVSDAVGATAGSFSVDQQGNANYSIPIYSPRGVGGLTPSVSLNYNSGGGDGLVGFGWNIGGISSISLCRATQEHGDGTGVQAFIQTDPRNGAVFCLDGERMVLINGSNGAVNSQYRLENDNQTIVVIENTVDVGSGYVFPSTFAAYAKDGTIRRYGSSKAQLSFSPNLNSQWTHIAQWYQFELRDSNNNVVNFNYTCAKTDVSANVSDVDTCATATDATRAIAAIVPRSITWLGGEIAFRGTVQDPVNCPGTNNTNYTLGFPIVERYRVCGIDVKGPDGTVLRSYNTYTTPGSENPATREVTSIKECVGTTCFAPTKFDWYSIASGAGFAAGQPSQSASSFPFDDVAPGNVQFGDIDGDGRADIVWLDPDNTKQGMFHAILSSPTATGIGVGTELCGALCPKNGIYGSTTNKLTGANVSVGTWKLVDFNGDGRSDLLTVQRVNSAYHLQVALSTGSGFSALNPSIRVPLGGNPADSSQFTTMPVNANPSASDNVLLNMQIADFDGDGLPDLLTVGSGAQIYLLKATGLASQPYVYQGPYSVDLGALDCNIGSFAANNLRIGDFNGDGKADIVVLLDRTTRCTSNGHFTGGQARSLTQPSIASVTTTSADGSASKRPPVGAIGSGTAGDTVTITGNFNPNAAGNQVQFNGATAVISSASATQLTAIVPADATTGPLAVTAFDSIVFSSGNFVINGTPAPAQSNTPVATFQVMVTLGHDASTFYLNPSSGWSVGLHNDLSWVRDASVLQVGDLNGDGLADVVHGFYDSDSGDEAGFVYQLNLGNAQFSYNWGGSDPSLGCVLAGCVSSGGASRFQVADYDGDGKADVWLPGSQFGNDYTIPTCPVSDNSCDPNYFNIFQWRDSHISQTPVRSPLYAGNIHDPHIATFQVDLDGDGYPDTFAIDTNQGSWYATRFKGGLHHAPRNAISKITSGLGAITEIDYAPMTFGSVYYHENTGTQPRFGWQVPSGWGGPVQDVFTPRWVVQYVDSSAPTAADINKTSTVRYRYGGYLVQGYGRGSLGFHTMYTTDQKNQIETITTYNQGFPITGSPSQTQAWHLSNPDTTDACLTSGPDNASCMLYSNAQPTISGTKLSQSTDQWGWHVRGTAGFTSPSLPSPAAPIVVERLGSTSFKYELNDGTLLSSSKSTMAYDDVATTTDPNAHESYGNLVTSIADDYADFAQSQLLREVSVTNKYGSDGNGDKPVLPKWYLGRLSNSKTKSTVYYADGTSDVKNRESSFSYDYSGTGQLIEEDLQPNGSADQALVKYHLRDAYGNEIQGTTCSKSVVTAGVCTSTLNASQISFRPSDANWVQRYTRSTFDGLSSGSNTIAGIYPNFSYAPFSDGTTGNAAIDYPTQTIAGRDPFGNVTDVFDGHNVETKNYFGLMGRQYFSASATGAAQQTSYRWCSTKQPAGVTVTANCPGNAVYVVDTRSDAGGTARAPESWTYFDMLGREVMRVQQGFDATTTPYVAATKDYDELGRVAHVSEPYVAANSQGAPASGAVVYSTSNTYDELGRAKSITHPNNSVTTIDYSVGLKTTTTLPANASGYAEKKTQTRDLLGQVVSVKDDNGSLLTTKYDASGNVVDVTRVDHLTSSNQPKVTAQYDDLGRKQWMLDPDLIAKWNYKYNALGEQVQQYTSATCTATFYDGQGRVHTKSTYRNGTCANPYDSTATWTFDASTAGLGQLNQVNGTDASISDTKKVNYDSFGRPTSSVTTIGTASYTQRATYDQFGRPYQNFFSGVGIPETGELYLYNDRGYAYQTQDAGISGNVYRQILSLDQRGNAATEKLAGNSALTTTRVYEPAMGWLDTITTGSGAVQQLGYTYDALGNMRTRSDTSGGSNVSESFGYDNLQRLVQQTGSSPTSWSFDDFGNTKVNAQDTYGTKPTSCTAAGDGVSTTATEVTPGPDALSSLQAGTVYCYEGHGNQTRVLSGGVAQQWNFYSADDKLRRVETQNSSVVHTTDWVYGPLRERLVRTDYTNASGSGAAATVTHYVGDAEIIGADKANPTVKRYLPGLILSQTGSTITYEYLFTDNLGSTHRITDANGTIYGNGKERFTAFGQRADATNDTPLVGDLHYRFDDSLTHHGYTGHEQMDESGLVHMNGRVYSPSTTRFTSPDPFMQDPGNLQNYNRYSYVLNNPLITTDPTGYWGHRQQGYVREVVAIAIAVYTGCYFGPGGAGAAASASEAATASVMVGYTSGLISSGNLKGAVLGGLSAGLNYGIGQAFPVHGAQDVGTQTYFKNVGAHALAGGVVEILGGGKFGHGFISAGGGAALSPMYSKRPLIAGIQASTVGGTLSEITGGKFANGAITSAFEFAFNYEMHGLPDWLSKLTGAPTSAESEGGDAAKFAQSAYQEDWDREVRTAPQQAADAGMLVLFAASFAVFGEEEELAIAGGAIAEEMGILRSASFGKGNFGLGAATRATSERVGTAWVGEGYEVASDGKTLLSADGLRQYRPPSLKPRSPFAPVQANFESREIPRGQWQSNGHLNITD